MGQRASSINGAGKIGQLYVKEWTLPNTSKLEHFQTPYKDKFTID